VQASCPKCANKIVIDDARVPDRAFSVKCPKCQNSVRFPGKGAAAMAPSAAAPAAPPAAPPEPEPARPADPDPAASADMIRAEMMAQVRRDMALGDAVRTASGRAIVSLADRAQAGAIAAPLTRQGYQVDTIDNPEEASRLIEQGVYDLVVASRAATPAAKESLYQRMSRLSPDARRRVFLVLVGDDFKTGDGTQAWITLADLVLNPRDLGSADGILTRTVEERTRLYQVFLDARKRFEVSSAV
jgi:predicted Zn finger-like uncharacterized protein